MGGACTKSARHPHKDKLVARRMGNFTFDQYRTPHLVSKTAGRGCKQTPAWRTSCTRQDIIMKREEFWDTRTQGDLNTWRVLRMACEVEDSGNFYAASAEAIVKAAGINMPQGSLALCYDGGGAKYELPPYVVNDAEEYGTGEQLPPLPSDFPDQQLNITIRSSLRGDVDLQVSSLDTGRKVKQLYQTKASATGPLRLFYGGKEITDEVLLAQRQVKTGVVVQAMGS